MKITLLPKTKTGKWSVSLFFAFITLIILVQFFPQTARSPDMGNILETPLFTSIVFLHFVAAISAAITGLIASIKNNERSVLVFVSIPLGVLYLCGSIIVIIGLIINVFV